MDSLPIPDELVTEIFLRLPAPADVVRASAACVSLHRVAAGRSFLRRFRKLHARPLLGFLDSRSNDFYPAIAPHPSAAAASVAALAGDFSFSFLPAPASDWRILDIRDGRVLLYRQLLAPSIPPASSNNTTSFSRDMVVCDPLHRRYLLLPPITYDLLASSDLPPANTMRRLEMFLVPPGDEAAAAEETSFRVIWMFRSKTSLFAFLFSSNTGQWRAITPHGWSDLTARYYLRQYVYGCFYWYWLTADFEGRKLLVLDTKTMEFSFAKRPQESNGCCDFAMVEAGEGRPGLFVLADSDLNYFIRQTNGGSSSQWQMVKTISLCSPAYLICSWEKYLLLHQGQRPLPEAGRFTLDIETFQLERVCTLDSTVGNLHAYSNFPPSLLSSPTISSDVENKAEKEMGEQACAASSSAYANAEGHAADWRCW